MLNSFLYFVFVTHLRAIERVTPRFDFFRKYFQLDSFLFLFCLFSRFCLILRWILFRLIVAINLKETSFRWTKFSLSRYLTLLDNFLSIKVFIISFFLINPVSIACLAFIIVNRAFPLFFPLLIPYALFSSSASLSISFFFPSILLRNPMY